MMRRGWSSDVGSEMGTLPNSLGEHLRELAEPYPPGDRIKAAIDRAARRIGLTYWRTFDLWYGKARRVEPHEQLAIAEALERKRREAARNELHELQIRIARLEARLAQTDAEFHRVDIEALRRGARPRGA
jgi:hypothetical protein